MGCDSVEILWGIGGNVLFWRNPVICMGKFNSIIHLVDVRIVPMRVWIVRWLLGLSLLILLAVPLSAKEDVSRYLVVPIQDKIISPPLAEFVVRQIEIGQDYDGIVFLIDTPGGFLQATQKIVEAILSSKAPTVAYIYPKGSRAGSAGVFISFACDMVVMAPHTRIGAAHPVMFGFKGDGHKGDEAYAEERSVSALDGGDRKKIDAVNDSSWSDTRVMQEKVLNDVLAMFRSYLKDKHPNVDETICESLIKKSRSLTDKEAWQAHLIDGICSGIDEVLALGEKKGIFPTAERRKIVWARMDGMDLFMYYLMNPYLLYVLSSVSIILLLFEITHPGFGLPGIIGLVGLGLVMYGYGFLPVNYLGVLLTGLGILFCVAEVFVPGFGLLVGSGIVLMLWGAVLMWRSPASLFRFDMGYLLPVVLFVGGAVVGIVTLAVKIKRKPAITGASGMVGKIGKAVEDVTPKGGKVFCMGEYWDAYSEGDRIEKGSEIEVVRVDGLRLVVRERRG